MYRICIQPDLYRDPKNTFLRWIPFDGVPQTDGSLEAKSREAELVEAALASAPPAYSTLLLDEPSTWTQNENLKLLQGKNVLLLGSS